MDVSVVIPAFNAERFIASAVDSVLAQPTVSLEAIVVDDGSSDATVEIVAGIANRDSRVTLLRRPHGGVAAALNFGFSHARGRFIARMDSDDLSAPGRFEDQMCHMDCHPELAVLGGWIHAIDCQGKRIGTYVKPTKEEGIMSYLNRANPIIHSTAMIRADSFRSVGGYREAFEGAEDYDLWLRIAEFRQIDNLPKALGSLRLHGEQVSCRSLVRQAILAKLARLAADARIRGADESPWVQGILSDRVMRLPRHDLRILREEALNSLEEWLSILKLDAGAILSSNDRVREIQRLDLLDKASRDLLTLIDNAI